MTSTLLSLITSPDEATRNQSLDGFCGRFSFIELLSECDALESFRHRSDNLYERVRAMFFLYAIHRFHLPTRPELAPSGQIPFKGHEHLLQRRFEEAIDVFLSCQHEDGPSDSLSSALAATYHRLAIQTLADQVRRSVRNVRGNQWMFRMGHPNDQPLRLRSDLLLLSASDGSYPILCESTPVRMDLTHSGWSDIFFSRDGTIPRARRCSMSRSISVSMAGILRLIRLSRRGCVSLTSRSCGSSVWISAPGLTYQILMKCSTSQRTTWDCSKPQ